MKKSLSSRSDPQQRFVITFSREERLKYIAHLDMMRLWHRALRRAGMPLAYSQGYNPQPRIAIAAPLAVGVTSEGEMIDILLERRVSMDVLIKELSDQLPDGVRILDIRDIWMRLPSLQSQVTFAEYVVKVEKEMSSEELKRNRDSFLEKESLLWQHLRGSKIHKYDLRRLVDDISIVQEEGQIFVLGMRLCNDSRGAGRPEQVSLALGFQELPKSIHRTRLITEVN